VHRCLRNFMLIFGDRTRAGLHLLWRSSNLKSLFSERKVSTCARIDPSCTRSHVNTRRQNHELPTSAQAVSRLRDTHAGRSHHSLASGQTRAQVDEHHIQDNDTGNSQSASERSKHEPFQQLQHFEQRNPNTQAITVCITKATADAVPQPVNWLPLLCDPKRHCRCRSH